MTKFMILGSNGMLASAFQRDDFFKENIVLDLPECDITDFEATERYVKEHRPQYLINCAAFTDVTLCETNLDKALSVNADGPKNLARLANLYDCQLIHFSTDFVFKGDKNIMYTEDMMTNPVNNYGLSKLRGEENVIISNPNSLIIRISWLYGANGKNFVSTISQLMRTKSDLSIVFDQYGKTTYTPDVVQATKHLILSKASGIYHFANEGVCSRYEFACKILEILKRKENIDCALHPIKAAEYIDTTPRPTFSVLSCQKYTFLTGEKIRHWEEALEDFLIKS